ncbi:MAG: hypothetical protein GY938_30820 [Ketobacter sp.]|nr:hypothetical protein [Ketobacter sp.]
MTKTTKQQLALAESPQDFFKSIPTDLKENAQYRIKLHGWLATDRKAQDAFLWMCKQYLPIAFNTTFWTLSPKGKTRANNPFILRPAQIPAVETLCYCIDNECDAGIEKNRGEGASEIMTKTFVGKALLEEYSHFILGSRKEMLVDKSGDLYTLFAKADSVMDHLPSWWLRRCGYNPNNDRNLLMMQIPYNDSRITGEATNESFSAGSRATAIGLDEFGRVPFNDAIAIEGSVHDVSGCVVYSSTHWLGTEHEFNKCLKKSTTINISLMWSANPRENMGLYETPEPGQYKIIDEGYYKGRDLSEALLLPTVDEWSPTEERVQFIVDGLKGIPSPYRAPWFDAEEKKRRGNRRDFICNVCGKALGASDAPFDHGMLEDIKKRHIRRPDLKGELVFEADDAGRIVENSMEFAPGRGAKRLRWWGGLPFGRPDQKHNYIIAADPSYGLGSANSAGFIVDVNLHEQVGSWADANTKPEDFADQMVALAHWIGGIAPCYLIWESTGGCGSMFGQRVLFQRYTHVYTQRREDSKTRKKTSKYGFNMASTAIKDAILGELGIALSGGLANVSEYKALIIHDENLLVELKDYVFREKGKGAVCSSKADLSTGALERHGDRVIAAGLCVLAYKEQAPGDLADAVDRPHGSFAWFEEQKKQQQAKDKRDLRRVLF